MGLVDWLAKRNGYVKPRQSRKYAAADRSRLLSNWSTAITNADAEARESLRELRARSRQLERDDDYAKRYLTLMQVNVVGPEGVLMQNKATLRTDPRRFDNRINDLIEREWRAWAGSMSASIDGKMSWPDMQALWIKTLCRDGEPFVRFMDGDFNRHGLALQFIEADHFDEDRNSRLANGNVIEMSIEKDQFDKPIAYWMTVGHPGQTLTINSRVIRIPAVNMNHSFIQDRPGQTRGVPAMHAAMVRLYSVTRYEKTELVAATVSAAKMGIITTPSGDEYVGDDEDEAGNKLVEAEPGTFEELPAGQELTMFDPTHPSGNYEPFVKQNLRAVAAGLGVSYESLTGDLTGVNFSSIRAGTLETRDMYRVMQRFTIRHFCQPVFDRWLVNSIMRGVLPFGLLDIPFISKPEWMVRGWDWVDPLKDTKASIEAIDQGLTTRTRELAKQGRDYEETLKELEREKLLAEQYNVEFGSLASKHNEAVEHTEHKKSEKEEDEDE